MWNTQSVVGEESGKRATRVVALWKAIEKFKCPSIIMVYVADSVQNVLGTYAKHLQELFCCAPLVTNHK